MSLIPHCRCQKQTGFVLMFGLVMLVVITLIGVSVIRMGTINLRSVNNMQARAESMSALERVINDVLSKSFTDAPSAYVKAYNGVVVDANNSYNVNVTQACITSFYPMTSTEVDSASWIGTSAQQDAYKSICKGGLAVNPNDNIGLSDDLLGNMKVTGCNWVSWRVTANVDNGWFGTSMSLTQGIRIPMWYSRLANTWYNGGLATNRCPTA